MTYCWSLGYNQLLVLLFLLGWGILWNEDQHCPHFYIIYRVWKDTSKKGKEKKERKRKDTSTSWFLKHKFWMIQINEDSLYNLISHLFWKINADILKNMFIVGVHYTHLPLISTSVTSIPSRMYNRSSNNISPKNRWSVKP